jgi:hypothetical protein
MAIRRPSQDDRSLEREDEIQNPHRRGDIDEIGAATGDADPDDPLDEDDDDAFEDDEETDDNDTDEEDVG